MSVGEETLALHLRAHGIPFEREYRFAPPRRWRADFAHIDARLLIEVEGGTWQKVSRHKSGIGYAADCEKYNAATEQGWRVLRYTTEMVRAGDAVAQIVRILATDGG